MIVESKHFGKVEISSDKILNFEDGIPGFEDLHRFGMIDNNDPNSPFKWIQSIDEPDIAFALVNPFEIKKDYGLDINEEIQAFLGLEDISQVEVYAIVVVPEDLQKMSMNLKAPIVLNTCNKKAAQIILDTDKYTVRHYILEELQKQEV